MNDFIKLTYQRDSEEIRTMDFKKGSDSKYSYFYGSGHLFLKQEKMTYKIYLNDITDNEKDITKSLNPLYLEFITQEDCPECKKNKRSGIDIGMSDKEFGNRRRNSGLSVMKNHFCTDGRVKLSTGFYSFKGKDNYDEKICEDFWQSTNAKENR